MGWDCGSTTMTVCNFFAAFDVSEATQVPLFFVNGLWHSGFCMCLCVCACAAFLDVNRVLGPLASCETLPPDDESEPTILIAKAIVMGNAPELHRLVNQYPNNVRHTMYSRMPAFCILKLTSH